VPAYTAAVGSLFGFTPATDTPVINAVLLLLSLSTIWWSSWKAGKGFLALWIAFLGASVVLAGKFYFHLGWVSVVGNIMMLAAAMVNVYPSIMTQDQGGSCAYVPPSKRRKNYLLMLVQGLKSVALAMRDRVMAYVHRNIMLHAKRRGGKFM
jgi:hypothetical protein